MASAAGVVDETLNGATNPRVQAVDDGLIPRRLRPPPYVAHAQGARLLELRAAVALARHCRERGRTAEARALLTAAHAWFAEHPPAAREIVAARQLLAELQE